MKKGLFLVKAVLLLVVLVTSSTDVLAVEPSQVIKLDAGWNIISTPMLVESHSFSATEDSSNFDIYALDASMPTGWATMADLGQTEFTPLFGYFVNNKTGQEQTLTLNYDTTVAPNEKLFEREFSSPGWYSIGVANDQYAKDQTANLTDTNNPSKILSLLNGKYDLVIDFTDATYPGDRKNVALSDPWKAAVAQDVDLLNDFRETKGYAIYIKEAGALYNGFQNDAVVEDNSLVISTSSDNPDAGTLKIENTQTSDWYSVLSFDFDTADSLQDLTLNSIDVTVEVSTSTYATVVNDAKLVLGGQTFTGVTTTDEDTDVATLTFTVDPAYTIDAGNIAKGYVYLRFNSAEVIDQETGVTTYLSSSNASSIDYESAGTVTVTGSALGNTQTLLSAGAVVEFNSDSAVVTNVDGPGDDYATFKISLDVTAVEQDVFINTDASTSVSFAMRDGAGSTVAGNLTAVLEATADEQGSYFVINEGETETITLTVTFDALNIGTAVRLQLLGFTYDSDGGSENQTWEALPLTDYRTDVVTIVN